MYPINNYVHFQRSCWQTSSNSWPQRRWKFPEIKLWATLYKTSSKRPMLHNWSCWWTHLQRTGKHPVPIGMLSRFCLPGNAQSLCCHLCLMPTVQCKFHSNQEWKCRACLVSQCRTIPRWGKWHHYRTTEGIRDCSIKQIPIMKNYVNIKYKTPKN